MANVITQYELVLVSLDPTIGSELKKTRPCVVVSPNEMNRNISTVTVCPVTTTSKAYPTRVKITVKKIKGWIVVDQIRTIDKRRVIKSLGHLNEENIRQLKSVIKETFVD